MDGNKSEPVPQITQLTTVSQTETEKQDDLKSYIRRKPRRLHYRLYE